MTKGVLLAVCSFVMGASVFSVTLYTLILEEQLQTTHDMNSVPIKDVSQHFQHAFGLHLDKTSIDTVVSFILLLSLLTMIFSILLIIGIKKNKPSLVVAYFCFGFLLCLLLVVTTVLELLQQRWYLATGTAIIAFILSERLSAVYSIYENMEKDSEFSSLWPENEATDHVSVDNVRID